MATRTGVADNSVEIEQVSARAGIPIESTVAVTTAGWQKRYPALTYPNYRLWFFGQIFTAFGMWVQGTAQGYLVYELTRSPAYLGTVTFIGGLPTWLFTLYAGVVADRVPRRTLLAVTQALMMVLGLTMALLVFLRLIQPWHILVMAFLVGTVGAFEAPARQAFVLEIVERRDLANAIVLNSMMFNVATTVGPAVAGFTYALFGPAWCFLINGLSYSVMIVALLSMKLKPFAARQRYVSPLTDIREGLAYTTKDSLVLILLLVVASTSLFGLAFGPLIPAWAVRILGGDATTNGLLQSARGVGALLSALAIASLGRFHFKGKLLTVGTLTLPLMVLAFSQVRWLPLAMVFLGFTGLAFTPIVSLANTLVQIQTPDALRGRVMSLYTLVFFGMWPLAGLWAGAVAQRFGEPVAVRLGACLMLLIAVAIFVFFPKLRAHE